MAVVSHMRLTLKSSLVKLWATCDQISGRFGFLATVTSQLCVGTRPYSVITIYCDHRCIVYPKTWLWGKNAVYSSCLITQRPNLILSQCLRRYRSPEFGCGFYFVYICMWLKGLSRYTLLSDLTSVAERRSCVLGGQVSATTEYLVRSLF